MTSSPTLGKSKKRGSHFFYAVADFLRALRERVGFSLENREIRLLAGFGARRGNVLRGAGYAWTPGLRVFDNSKR